MAEQVRTACSYCGVGCGIVVSTADTPAGPVIARVVGDRLHPSNAGRLCTKGATHTELMAARDGRLATALARPARAHPAAPVDADTAARDAGERLRAILDQHGPDAIALYVSGQLSIEAQYLATKLAKGFIGTTHLESNSRLCMASAGSGYKQSLGSDGPPGSYDDFDCADLFFVIGSNMADCHPILYLRMADRLRAGAKLIVVDPRRTATAANADLFLQIRPGADLALLNGLLHLLVESGDIDAEFIAEHTQGWDGMPEFLADYPPARVAEVTGLAESDIRTAATMIAEAGAWVTCWTMGLNQSTHGTWNTTAICNLHLATGAICRPGSGPLSLTGQPNAMGGREMGYLGPGLPGQRSVASAEDRAFVEDIWGLPAGAIRSETGPGTVALFERMAAGDVRACWIVGTNPVASVPNRDSVIAGLTAAELVITQDVYADTATNRYADITLPATLWAEAEGVMVNSERTLTLLRQAVPPPGQARPDWQLICQVAAAMGFGAAFDYRCASEIFDEIRRFWNPLTGYDLRGASYSRLREGPLQWPSPPGDAEGRHPIRYLNDGVSQHQHLDANGRRPRLAFATESRRAVFHPRPYLPPAELPDADYPMLLNTGRLPHQWHTMTKTGRVPALTRLDSGPFVEVHPADAAALGLVDGQGVEVRSRRGRAVLPAVVTDRVRPGSCFAPFHWNDEHGENLTINALTSDAVDPVSLQPELKVCAVRLRPIGTAPAARISEPRTRHTPAPAGGLWVLWASQTGAAEQVAAGLVDRLAGAGVDATLVGMDDCAPGDLLDASDLLVVTSTFGDGGPPDNGTVFWDRLRDRGAPALSGIRFAVLGIGDRSYGQFCGHARSLDDRFAELGAVRLLDRIDCEADDDEPRARWVRQVTALVGGSDDTVGDQPVPAADPFTRANPISARLCRNTRLTPPGAGKEVRQFGFDLSDHAVTYRAGDALGVLPTNNPDAVAAWLATTGLSGAEVLTVDGAECTLRHALTHSYDFGRVTPEQMNAMPARATAEQWQDVLVRLTPRLYSISSSPLVSPQEVQLTVAVVRHGVNGGGVCSTFLADRADATPVPVFLRSSPHFQPPEDPRVPMVMIGAGTGIAPFRGFLQHRRALGHTGRNWLFFGDQHAATNFYYRDELTAMADDGLLTRLDLAFSRDQQQRIYVQHRMIERGAQLWTWLQDGARLYVCGDAATMAKGVDAALTMIIATHGRLNRDQARDCKRDLVATKRYLRDVY